LLRATVGITAAVQAWLSIPSTSGGLAGAIPAATLVACGVALALGIFTPVCSTFLALGYALVLSMPAGGARLLRLDAVEAILGLASAAGVALLGPGAFSIDARLFGRREIFIPAKDDSERR
jgi:putative oxidoreductase